MSDVMSVISVYNRLQKKKKKPKESIGCDRYFSHFKFK